MQVYQYNVYTAIIGRSGHVISSGVVTLSRMAVSRLDGYYAAKAQAFASARHEADALEVIEGERLDVIIDAQSA